MSRMMKYRAWTESGYVFQDEWPSLEAFFAMTDDKGYGDFRTVYQLWTGLKDANGKEIYDGDIISLIYEDGRESLEVVMWDVIMTGFYPFNKLGIDEYGYAKVNDYKIIGNRFENLELYNRVMMKY